MILEDVINKWEKTIKQTDLLFILTLLQVICFFEFGLNFIVKLRFKEATQVYRKKNNENNVEKNVYKCR